jgi:hypothetical protein
MERVATDVLIVEDNKINMLLAKNISQKKIIQIV